MTPNIAILAPGIMGAAIAARMVSKGVRVSTILSGRSEQTVERAKAAGMLPVTEGDIAEVDILLSIVPPAEAMAIARQLAPVLSAASRKPVYVDCNAINPESAALVAAIIEATGCPFVDGSLIGMPPREGYDGPTLFVSGLEANRVVSLTQCGLNVRKLNGPVGAASALKMCYGGITKGLIAIGSAMMLAAVRAGADRALLDEMGRSQSGLLAGFSKSIPDMFTKSARWVPEMREVSAMLGPERPEGEMFEAIACLYERLANDEREDRQEIAMLEGLFSNR
jgi:3-hydroxyisobutyrate dehydrogenase-like beta-hydroxyacid dehydrogenase